MKNIYLLLAMLAILACKRNPTKEPVENGDEIKYRLNKTIDRITKGELPTITKDFLLAEVTLDPKYERRFTEFSGDQLGRYLSAMSLVDSSRQRINIQELVSSVIANQKKDGRFGTDSLVFDARKMQGAHMALLWGNGRLLNGLLDFYSKYPERKDALASATRLGDFLYGVTEACNRPEIINRFKTMGALGFICFTQITEGLVKLYSASGNEKYRTLAEKIYPLLPESGDQHSHGYLTTLRGIVLLYEVTKNPIHLQYAEKAFEQVVSGKNYLISGGVPEFFNFHQSAEGVRDEGCSEADFFMLCLQLWKATGENKYFDKAEYILMNQLMYNQYMSGDFGHHVIKDDFGFISSPTPGQSWWCCNYHGLQALMQAQKVIISGEGKLKKINLFYEENWADKDIEFKLTKTRASIPSFKLEIIKVLDKDVKIAIRNPYWSNGSLVLLNGKPANTVEDKGYLVIQDPLRQGDEIRFSFRPVLKLVDRERNEISLPGLSAKPSHGALTYGPWLMSVDDVSQNLFMTELSDNNIIYIPADLKNCIPSSAAIPENSFIPEAYLSFSFLKEGTSQKGRVMLRPISELSFQGPSNVRFWLNFAR